MVDDDGSDGEEDLFTTFGWIENTEENRWNIKIQFRLEIPLFFLIYFHCFFYGNNSSTVFFIFVFIVTVGERGNVSLWPHVVVSLSSAYVNKYLFKIVQSQFAKEINETVLISLGLNNVLNKTEDRRQ